MSLDKWHVIFTLSYLNFLIILKNGILSVYRKTTYTGNNHFVGYVSRFRPSAKFHQCIKKFYNKRHTWRILWFVFIIVKIFPLCTKAFSCITMHMSRGQELSLFFGPWSFDSVLCRKIQIIAYGWMKCIRAQRMSWIFKFLTKLFCEIS